MKKIISLLLALCLVAALLPIAALADEAVPKIRCFNGPNSKNFYITPSATTPYYIVSKEDKTFEKWTGAEAPADNYVKFELIVGSPSVVKATFHNFNIDNFDAGGYTCHSIEFQAAAYDVEIVLEGASSMLHGQSASIKCSNAGNTTIYGDGSLYLEQTEQAAAPLWIWNGDLLIKDTTLSIKVAPLAGTNSTHQGILSSKGNVTIDNCKITSDTIGGSLVWMGPQDARNSRTTVTDDTTRIITVKNSELDIKVHVGAAFASAAPAVISNTTMKVTKTSASGRAIFVPAPTFEGEHTAIAGLAKNAENFSKLKVYQASKVGSYTFIYLVPGIQDLIPTEPEPEVTVPSVTDPDPIVPETTTPDATEPDATEPTSAPTTPAPTTPAESKPATSTPDATQSAGDNADKTDDATDAANTDNADNKDGGKEKSPIAVVMITVLVMVVLAGGAVATLIILKKKGIIK